MLRICLVAALSMGLCACDDRFDSFDDSAFVSTTFRPPPRPLEGLVIAETPPPPISGGTLLAAADDRTVLASDPDRDLVWVVDAEATERRVSIPLRPGEEPGRLAEAPGRRFWVVLRSGGAVARIDSTAWEVDLRRPVCNAPRGIAYDENRDRILVACEGGELISLDPEDGTVLQRSLLQRDLRDVVVQGDVVYVSRFRAAEVLFVDPQEMTVSSSVAMPTQESGLSGARMIPSVAYRMTPLPGGGVMVVHQATRDPSSPVPTAPTGGYYGDGDCSTAIVQGTVTTVTPGGRADPAGPMMGLVLPVDVHVSQGGRVAIAAAGVRNDGTGTASGAVALGLGNLDRATFTCVSTGATFIDGRQVTAVVHVGDRLVMQSRDPWALTFRSLDGSVSQVDLPGVDAKDTGHDLFHEDTGSGIACASCHAEGGDDGVTWRFDLGDRRTQEIRGGLLGTEPLHWSGDMDSFAHLAEEVFSGRMAGPELPQTHVDAMAEWIDVLPAPPRAEAADPLAAERGRALFESAEVGCTGCHSGPRLSNDVTVDVGTGGAFQVPTLLGVGSRRPLLHHGRAETLAQRFDPTIGGGDDHGRTSHLTTIDINDLVAYLETL